MQTYGFDTPDFVTKADFENFRQSYVVVLERRRSRWRAVIDQGNLVRGSLLKRFCRKGIPAEFRCHVWMTLSSAYKNMNENPTVYQTASTIQPPKNVLNTIMADIPRTFPENEYFSQAEGKGSLLPVLERILIAFAVTFPRIGYCQGLNYVAATLLLAIRGSAVPEDEVEERTFWLLHALTHHIVPKYYSDRMIDVRIDCLVFEELLKKKAPSIYRTLKNANVDCIVLATKWFICLFADVLPIETVLRIFDSLFYEGDKILFRACIALTKLHSKEILYCQQFPDVVLTFREITQDKRTLYCHEFLKAMFKLPGSLPRSGIRKFREKYLVQVEGTLKELDDQERAYRDRMAQQGQETQPKSSDSAKNFVESYDKETSDDDIDATEGDTLKPRKAHRHHNANNIESSPSLNVSINHGNNNENY